MKCRSMLGNLGVLLTDESFLCAVAKPASAQLLRHLSGWKQLHTTRGVVRGGVEDLLLCT